MYDWGLVIGAIIMSIAGTIVFLKCATRLGLIQAPNERSSHEVVVPHGGGFGFVIAFLFSITILFFQTRISNVEWLALVCCGALVAGMAFWDDINHIAVRWRLLVYFLAVTVSVALLGGLPPVSIGNQTLSLGLLGDLGLVIVLVWWINLYNFMDGIDGLACSEAIFITLGAVIVIGLMDWLSVLDIAAEAKVIELLLLILAVSVSGFLLFNWPPAKVFMGDVGSTFLGYTIGMLALISVEKDVLVLWTWLILGGAFLVDATLTFLRRFMSGRRWYEAHRTHVYQKVANRWVADFQKTKGLTPESARAKAHGLVSLSLLAVNVLWLLPLAFAAQYWQAWGLGFVLLAWTPLVAFALYKRAGN